jgi:hypothetical protein
MEIPTAGMSAPRAILGRRERTAWARPSPTRSGRTTSSGAPTGEPDLLYIDLHLVHEVTSPQAFDGLRLAGRPVPRPRI